MARGNKRQKHHEKAEKPKEPPRFVENVPEIHHMRPDIAHADVSAPYSAGQTRPKTQRIVEAHPTLCPHCGSSRHEFVDQNTNADGSKLRQRKCRSCGAWFKERVPVAK